MEQPVEFDVDKELEDLENKLDRVRSLYEQYFIGIEKIEPQTPRKDIDRRIRALRKFQIRNTAQRFKFNMLVQRYNTLQTHWGRIVRKIENGTYKRDVMKAAAKFGADQVSAALGKVRELDQIQAEEERSGERVYELNENDVEWNDDWDDAPTPPPQPRRGASAPVVDLAPEPAGRTNPGAGLVALAGGPSAPPTAAASPTPGAAPVKKAGGLRWGGGPSKAHDPEAVKRKLAALAAQAGEELPAGAPSPGIAPAARQPFPPAPSAAGSGKPPPLMAEPLGLDFGPADANRAQRSAPPVPPAASSSPAASAPPGPGAPPSKRRPLLSSPLDVDMGSRPPPPPAGSAPPAPAPGPAPPSPARAAQRPSPPANRPPPGPPSRPRPPAPAKKAGADLSESRMREIYDDYVKQRKTRNESTSGLTYEKLSDSLRVQAEKLRAKHGGRSVDYQVVVKDGKTLIKPIVR